MAKLVLEFDMEPEVIKNAEGYAHERHEELPAMVSNLIKTMANLYAPQNNVVADYETQYLINKKPDEPVDPFLEKIKKIKISDDLKSLTGILKGAYPDDMDYKDMKYEYLKEKYGL